MGRLRLKHQLRQSLYDVYSSHAQFDDAQIVRIAKQGKGHNVNQIQFSPGGGRHGESPYIKISTTDNQGKIKVVFGKKADYKNEGNERATIIFTEE